jgi:epoxyqueuosine reductase
VALTNLQVSGLPAAGLPAAEPLYATAPRRRRAAPVAPVTRCGTCTLCLEACPTQAILPGGGLDAGRCLSTWTIERRGQAPAGRDAEQGGLLFGCDICQAVCPWNRHAARLPATDQPPRAEYAPLPAHAELSLRDLAVLPDEAFAARLRRTPLWRAHPDGLRRNAERVLSNLASGSRDGAEDQR